MPFSWEHTENSPTTITVITCHYLSLQCDFLFHSVCINFGLAAILEICRFDRHSVFERIICPTWEKSLGFYHCLKCMCSPKPHGFVLKWWSWAHFFQKNGDEHWLTWLDSGVPWIQDPESPAWANRKSVIWKFWRPGLCLRGWDRPNENTVGTPWGMIQGLAIRSQCLVP